MDGYGDALEGLRLMCQSGPSLEHLKVSNTLKGHVTQIRRYLWDARGTSSSYDVYTPPHMTSPYMSAPHQWGARVVTYMYVCVHVCVGIHTCIYIGIYVHTYIYKTGLFTQLSQDMCGSCVDTIYVYN